MKKIDKILVIRMSALGDVAMTIPVIYSFAKLNPECQITVLTRPFFAKLFLNKPENITLRIIDPKGEHKGIMGLFRIIRELRREKFDAVADLHNVLRSWIITFVLGLCGAKCVTVHKHRMRRRYLIRRSNKDLRPHKSFVMRYVSVFEKLGFKMRLNFTSLFGKEKGDKSLLPTEITSALDGGNCIGVAPFARYATKTLPAHITEQVVEALSRQGYTVMLFGSKGSEQDVLESWQNKYEGVLSLPGKLEMNQELIVMSHMKLMLTMDSSNMHLASLVGTKVVSVWGSTMPHCGFLGYNQNWDDCITSGSPCQPCSSAGVAKCPNGTLQCLNNISSDKILKHIELLINKK